MTAGEGEGFLVVEQDTLGVVLSTLASGGGKAVLRCLARGAVL